MDSVLHNRGRIGSRTLLLTATAAVPLTGRAVLATATHPSINGRRAGGPGTAAWGRAA